MNAHRVALLLVSILHAIGLSVVASPVVSAGYQNSVHGIDLSAYRVTDPDAGLFDVAQRMDYLRGSESAILRAEIERLRTAISCRSAQPLPVINTVTALPSFYEDNGSWRQAAAPFLDFEESVTTLAAAFVASSDRYYADCLIEMLHKWAIGRAFLEFHYTTERRQIWYAIESSLFAAAQSYAIVRPFVRDRMHADQRPQQLAEIENWLTRAATKHLSVTPAGDSCCNNHFYRRALHATAIGILTNNDDLFRVGVSALFLAVSELNSDGSLPREMKRGSRAAHYQNYAVLYLVQIAELVERQGYPIYEITTSDRSLHQAVRLALDLLDDTSKVGAHTRDPQNLWYQDDPQYFVWTEIYSSRFQDRRTEAVAARYRPMSNRSSIGAATLYFLQPAPVAATGNEVSHAD